MTHTDFWAMVNSYYGKKVEDTAMKLFVKETQEIPVEKLNEYFKMYRRDKTNRFAPLPADLTAMHMPPRPNNRQLAIELAQKINHLICNKCRNWAEGYWSSQGTYYHGGDGRSYWFFEEAVNSEIGEIGWQLIKKRGSWLNLCESRNNQNEATFIANLRDQIEGLLDSKKEEEMHWTLCALGYKFDDEKKMRAKGLFLE